MLIVALKGSRTAMPLSKEADAARKREKRGAEARAQEKVALQSEARASFVATVGEAHEASERHKPDVAAPSQQRVRSKRIAEAGGVSVIKRMNTDLQVIFDLNGEPVAVPWSTFCAPR